VRPSYIINTFFSFFVFVIFGKRRMGGELASSISIRLQCIDA